MTIVIKFSILILRGEIKKMDYENWQLIIMDETKELENKINKLGTYLEKQNEPDPLLVIQYSAMVTYFTMLETRISEFDKGDR